MTAPECLDRNLILKQMDDRIRAQLQDLVIETSVDSTSSALQRLPVSQQPGTALLAEHQTAGRGRRGKHWHSPRGGNVYLSLGWHFNLPLVKLGCLPLVVALSAAQALSRVGLKGHRIKWPNDLFLGGEKLGGCLVEMTGDASGPCHAIVGVGINVRMPALKNTSAIDQPWTDLSTHLPDCSRNTLAALLLEELLVQLPLFAKEGFAPFNPQWEHRDVLKGQHVDIASGHGTLSGVVAGIDASGALLLNTGAETLSLHSGEVSLHKPV